MSGQRGDEGRPRDGRTTDGEVLRSVLAGALAVATGAVLTWSYWNALHFDVGGIVLGGFFCGPLAPGFAIGVLDRRRPFVTTVIATVLFFVSVVAWTVWRGDGVSAMLLVGGVACCVLALLGAGLGRVAVREEWGPTIVVALLISIFVMILVGPEVAHRRTAAHFVRTRQADVEGIVGREVVRLPSTGVEWHHDLVGGLERGVGMSAAWLTETEAAGDGECHLSCRWTWLRRRGELYGTLILAGFSFRPSRPVRLGTRREAEALLTELGVRIPPGALSEGGSDQWSVSWRMEREGWGHGPRHSVTVTADGRVEARREIPRFG